MWLLTRRERTRAAAPDTRMWSGCSSVASRRAAERSIVSSSLTPARDQSRLAGSRTRRSTRSVGPSSPQRASADMSQTAIMVCTLSRRRLPTCQQQADGQLSSAILPAPAKDIRADRALGAIGPPGIAARGSPHTPTHNAQETPRGYVPLSGYVHSSQGTYTLPQGTYAAEAPTFFSPRRLPAETSDGPARGAAGSVRNLLEARQECTHPAVGATEARPGAGRDGGTPHSAKPAPQQKKGYVKPLVGFVK